MNPHIVAFIFARGGSKGLPGKNIRPLDGLPLIAYSIKVAKALPQIDRVIVSTDCEKIASVAREYGAEVPFMRPAELAQDTSPEWLAWRHAIQTVSTKEKPVDVMLSLPTTSPLRSVDDVQKSLKLLLESDADAVMGIQETDRNPYFNMVVKDEANTIELAAKSEKKIHRRQDAPTIYDLTTVVYAVRAKLILEKNHLFEGKVKGVLVPRERAIDIDTELDFQIAEFLMTQSKQVQKI